MSDETMSVLPRILDPTMKFTVESIKNMPSKNDVTQQSNTKNDFFTSKKDTNKSENDTEEKETNVPSGNKFFIFLSYYKNIILLIIIIILLIVLIYIIYKYFVKNKKTTLEENKINKDSEKQQPVLSQDTKQKINEYVSNYIIDENDDNLKSINQEEVLQEEVLQEEIKQENIKPVEIKSEVNNKDIIIIQENLNINPELILDSRFQEIKSEDNLEMYNNENLDIMLDQLNNFEQLNDNNQLNSYEIESDKQSETNESIDLNNIINEIEDVKEENNLNADEKEENNTDEKEEINYFKKFANKNT